jgi:hypothetical protein
MRKPSVSIALFLLALIVVAFLFRSRSSQDADYEGFNRRVGRLEYSRHARCRMDCRQVSEAEVLDLLEHGEINPRKTRLDDKPCPTYALEGYSQQDHQHLRIVFAQCDNYTKVVTCIDLDRDLECHCP